MTRWLYGIGMLAASAGAGFAAACANGLAFMVLSIAGAVCAWSVAL